jgi:heat shock protein HslJ
MITIVAMACSQPAGSGDQKGVRPGDSAAGAGSTVTSAPMLENTYWRLVALGDAPVTPADTLRQAHITLTGGAERRVTGSGGCNRMFGSYTLDGTALAFSQVGATKMACAEGMDTESAFFSALERVAGWRITGQQLELTDSAGVPVARFEAQAPK